MNRVFQQSYHIPGTLSANITPVFTAPFDMQLVHISAVATNASTATIAVGTTTGGQEACYLAAKDVGDSSAPAELDRDDFVGAQFPHILKGTVVLITFDFNGAASTAAQNATFVLTFTEG